MALACDPDVIVADEPTTALDVMIQAQILELLRGIARDFGMGMILVTHDLGSSRRYATASSSCTEAWWPRRHAGTMFASAASVHAAAAQGVPDLAHPDRPLRGIPGSPPRLDAMPAGCRFARAARSPSIAAASSCRRTTLQGEGHWLLPPRSRREPSDMSGASRGRGPSSEIYYRGSGRSSTGCASRARRYTCERSTA